MVEQLEFDFGDNKQKISINKKIRLIELFSGYSSQAMALRNIGADFEIYKTSEWQVASTISAKAIFHQDDKTNYSENLKFEDVINHLVKMGITLDDKKPATYEQLKKRGEAYCRKVYNTFKACHNLGSITTIHGKDLEIIEKEKYCYFMFYSFCCQDLSLAGKKMGMAKNSGTRSGLLWEVERLLKECAMYNGNLPDILCLENVPMLISKRNISDFILWCNFLETLGYTNHYQILNSSDYGMPQNRERIFMMSFLGNYDYDFPKPIELKYHIQDILEKDVDPKYFVSNERTELFKQRLIHEGTISEI